MAVISKDNFQLALQSIKKVLSLELNTKLGKEDYYTDEEILEFLSETVNLSPVTENGAFLVEGGNYLVV